MKIAVADRPGPLAEVVRIREVPEPGEPAPGQVRVRMTATTVNPSDAVTVSGAYMSRTTFPMIPGFEGVGVIDSGPEEGRRVLPIGGPGCWSQLRNVDRAWCVPVPDDLDDATACFSYINPLTASMMVRDYCLPLCTPGRTPTVVVTAATSAIAEHIAELLTELTGVRPTGLVRGTPGHHVADPDRWASVVSMRELDWRTRVHGADVILDCVGGELGLDLVDALAPGGTLVLYGLLSGEPLPTACFDGRRGTRVEMFRLRDTIHAPTGDARSDLPGLFRPVFTLQRRGLLRTPVAARVGLSGLPDALRDLVSPAGATREGKLLIDPWS
ncbi:zinc-dependent alcohol dehydrogenase family protein [Corynebacterium variabile]|uniref:zinc-dependent alcohol dehydrogenase family protein n=1 Tax=Corynebacterium variabile TaxID=1727 RepID=UPI0028EB00F3|nr:zinc-dependent alcohol dehydrogenase family protein [Corynebacterium variabile]